jgi:hypothetical protein
VDAADRSEFERHFSILCAAFDVPCTDERKEAYWLAMASMPMLMFARIVQWVLTEEEWARIPKPGQLWQVKRRMRAGPPPREEVTADNWVGDAWDIVSNRHLLAYILRSWRDENKHFSAAETKTLVAYKKAWARDCREDGSPDVKKQKAWWIDCMNRARVEMGSPNNIAA